MSANMQSIHNTNRCSDSRGRITRCRYLYKKYTGSSDMSMIARTRNDFALSIATQNKGYGRECRALLRNPFRPFPLSSQLSKGTVLHDYFLQMAE